MRPERLELWLVELPLKGPFRSADHTLHSRQSVVLRMHTDEGIGWGESVAFEQPFFTAEFNRGVMDVIEQFCWPTLREQEHLSAARLTEHLRWVKGHQMAKSALEMAVLDAELRATGESLASHLGSTRAAVEVGVAVGIHENVDALIDVVTAHVADGYRRVKLKVRPGDDHEPVAAVRSNFGRDLMLQVDANGSYDPDDFAPLEALDEFDLLLIEQPFAEDDLCSHARLEESIQTSVCLDESITSVATARQALELGACSTINLKPGRVGGYLESTRIHDLALAREIPLWCGGMLELGLARAGNLALASLPGFTLPGDISATDRYFETDLTDAFELRDGMIAVPEGPGLGVQPDPAALERFGVLLADLR